MVLAEKNQCTGCTACKAVCPVSQIQMVEDAEGFLFPKIDQGCIACGACQRVCPVLNPPEKCAVSKAYAAYSKDDSIRMRSSSGGIFRELANVILSQGGVVFGAAYDDSFHVRYFLADNAEQVQKLQGAKYAQSALGDTFQAVKRSLKAGKKVLFVGTPCTVAGLKSFLQGGHSNLYCVDFICHGVPSPKAWKAYVQYRADHDNGGIIPRRINQRSKISGWSRYKYSIVYDYSDAGQVVFPNGKDVYINLFVQDYINRKSCENCQFKGIERSSDITIGDFWGIWDVAPEVDDTKGVSAVLIHTIKGKRLLDAIADRLTTREVETEAIVKHNPSAVKSSPENPKRKEILDMVIDGKYEAVEQILADAGKQEDLYSKIWHKVSSIFRHGSRKK